jgi:hypothetical protein
MQRARIRQLEAKICPDGPGADCPVCGLPLTIVIRWKVSGLPFAADCTSLGHSRVFLPGSEEEMRGVYSRIRGEPTEETDGIARKQ